MEELQQTVDVINNELIKRMIAEKCDGCSQSPLTIFRKGFQSLFLCGHHTNRVIVKLISMEWEIVRDDRTFKAEDPTFKKVVGVPGVDASPDAVGD